MKVYRQDAIDETGARVHIITVLGGSGLLANGIAISPMYATSYTHPAPIESPGPVADYCDVCNAALKALNP